MTQRPDLFGACLPAVGVMDMLRFHKFTAGRFWVDDYGSSDNPEEFKALYAYSPYHNLKKGTKYPATLVTTADTDDRVVPGHSFKFAAALQDCQDGPRAGADPHRDAGRPRRRQADGEADRGDGRRVGVPGQEPGDEGAGAVTTRTSLSSSREPFAVAGKGLCK